MTDLPTTVREARADEHAAVMNVLDGAALEVDAAAVGDRIPGDALVAVDDDRVLGACVVSHARAGDEDGTGSGDARAPNTHVEAIAVRPGRRGQGIGTTLIEAAAGRWGSLSAEFDAKNRPFYETLGFSIEALGGGRFRGVRPADVSEETGTGPTTRDRR